MIRWSPEKNQELIDTRAISFDEVVQAMNDDLVLDHYAHPNQSKYPGQRVFVVLIRGYPCVVPYVIDGEDIFLKTIIPSRKAKRSLAGGSYEN